MLTARSAVAQRSLTARGGAPSRPRLTGHANNFRGAPASSQRTQATSKPIYGREFEKEQLDIELKDEPRDLLLILGPRNCGKTALLKDFRQGKRHVVYVDCRDMNASNPTTFTSNLLKQLEKMEPPAKLKERVQELIRAIAAGATLSLPWVAWSAGPVSKLAQEQPAASVLDAVIETLNEIFDVWNKEAAEPSSHDQQNPTDTYGPVLIIDEANALMSWADTHSEELHCLLQYFVRITKQEQRCHVLMATSEFGYQTWVNKAIGSGNWRPQVIGDFMESEARDFLFQQLGGVSSSDGKSIDQDNKAWAAVYEVCGGNAGALGRLAKGVRKSSGCDWEEALQELWQVELDKVERLSYGGDGFVAVHYAAAALKLLDSSKQAWHTVGKRDMQELLGRYVEGTANKQSARVQAGAAVLKSLVQANALSVRPPSAWARDIPVQAFGKKSLVTAPSTMDLYCMRLIRPELEQILAEHDSAA